MDEKGQEFGVSVKRPKTIEQNVQACIRRNRDRITQAEMTARRCELEISAPTGEKQRNITKGQR